MKRVEDPLRRPTEITTSIRSCLQDFPCFSMKNHHKRLPDCSDSLCSCPAIIAGLFVWDYARLHTAPSLLSLTTTPIAASSSRMRSLSAQFLALRAS